MEARVNQSSRYGTVMAFSGNEYVKYEWRAVPAGCEAEAERHPYLEIKAVEQTEPEPVVPVSESVLIDPSDGISDAEASAAGKALAARKAQEQPSENAEQKPEEKAAQGEPKSSRRRK